MKEAFDNFLEVKWDESPEKAAVRIVLTTMVVIAAGIFAITLIV